jgi:hypothetical protein
MRMIPPLLLLLVLAACGSPNAGGAGQAAGAANPTPPPTNPVAPTPPTSDPQGAAMASLAQNQLAADLGIAPQDVAVVGVEAVEWNDSGLGCLESGQMALQVITPGYRVSLRANGTDYTFHTDSERVVKRCDNPTQ